MLKLVLKHTQIVDYKILEERNLQFFLMQTDKTETKPNSRPFANEF